MVEVGDVELLAGCVRQHLVVLLQDFMEALHKQALSEYSARTAERFLQHLSCNVQVKLQAGALAGKNGTEKLRPAKQGTGGPRP